MFKQEVQTLLNYLWEATNQPQFVALWSPGRLQRITSEKRRESNHLYIFYIMFLHQWTLGENYLQVLHTSCSFPPLWLNAGVGQLACLNQTLSLYLLSGNCSWRWRSLSGLWEFPPQQRDALQLLPPPREQSLRGRVSGGNFTLRSKTVDGRFNILKSVYVILRW